MGFKKSTCVEPLHLYKSNIFARFRYSLLSMAIILSMFIEPVKSDSFALTLVTGDDYPPFTDIKLPQGGIATSLVRRAFEKSGYFVTEIKWLPWKKGYSLAKRGIYHATYPYGLTVERAKYFYYSEPFLPQKSYAWTRQGQSNKINNDVDLHGMAYCIPRGYGSFGLIKRLMDQDLLRRETPNTMRQCFKMLQAKRIDFVAASYGDAMNALLEVGILQGEVQQSKFSISESMHYLIVSKQLARALEIIDAFNSGLKILKENGRYDVLKEELNWVE